jgi:hypothetical protein
MSQKIAILSAAFAVVLCLGAVANAGLIVTAVVPSGTWTDPYTGATAPSVEGVPATIDNSLTSSTVTLAPGLNNVAVHYYLYAYISDPVTTGLNYLAGAQGSIIANQGLGVTADVVYNAPTSNFSMYTGNGTGVVGGNQDLNQDGHKDVGGVEGLAAALTPDLSTIYYSSDIIAANVANFGASNVDSFFAAVNNGKIAQALGATATNAILIGGGTLLVNTNAAGGSAAHIQFAPDIVDAGTAALWGVNLTAAQNPGITDASGSFTGGADLTIQCSGGGDVPEPSTIALLTMAGLGLLFLRKRN